MPTPEELIPSIEADFDPSAIDAAQQAVPLARRVQPRQLKECNAFNESVSARDLLALLLERDLISDTSDDEKPRCRVYVKKVWDANCGRERTVYRWSVKYRRSGKTYTKDPCGNILCEVCGLFWRLEREALERSIPEFTHSTPPLRQSNSISTIRTANSNDHYKGSPPNIGCNQSPFSESPISSSLTSITPHRTPARRHVNKEVLVRRKRMIEMSDGSSWLPPTLESIQAFLADRTRGLSGSCRAVVANKVRAGSRVALMYHNEIFQIDSGKEKMSTKQKDIAGRGS